MRLVTASLRSPLLGRAEGEPPWRSTLALVFGALFAAYLFTDTSWDPAGNRGADLDPGPSA